MSGMSAPRIPVPDERRRRFGLGLCERLGLDPAMVGEEFSWEVNGDDDLAPVTFTVYLPAADVLAMWNGIPDVP